MLQDRDDKYEGSEDSEYHFSADEDVSYEGEEIETPKAAPVSEHRESSGGVAPSKRMIISLVVFLVLVFVVYKMVAPSSSVQAPTDITPPPPAVMASTAPASVNTAPVAVQPPIANSPANVPSNAPPATNIATTAIRAPAAPPVSEPQTLTPASAPQMAAAPPAEMARSVAEPTAAMPATPRAPGAVSQPAIAMQPATPSNAQMATPPGQPTMASAPMTVSGQMMPTQQNPAIVSPSATPTQTMPPAVAGAAPSTAAPGLPNVIPVQTPVPTTYGTNSPTMAMQDPNADAKIAMLESTSSKLMQQMQTEYQSKINDFSTQNRALQDQVQLLNSRMASMETQMGQLVQALTSRQPSVTPPPPPPSPTIEPAQPPEQAQTIDQKISYNVQAIIPGRAWLKSDNGETLTVAEGDVIKHLGRVTKIDPYDGTVEINTGTKMVSLSYGTGV